jgi:4'-phosphopantetheinyl transferase
MPLYLVHDTDKYRLAVWQMSETEEELLALLPHPDTYRAMFGTYKSAHRRLESLAVRVLLLHLLGKEAKLIYDKEGRPSLADDSHRLSISHTTGYAAVILSTHHIVGIDIEQATRRVANVRRFFLREDEEPNGKALGNKMTKVSDQAVKGTPEKTIEETDGRLWWDLLHWCAKETAFKCLFCDEVDFREHLQVLPFAVAPSGSFVLLETRTARRIHFTIFYEIHPDFALTYTYIPD